MDSLFFFPPLKGNILPSRKCRADLSPQQSEQALDNGTVRNHLFLSKEWKGLAALNKRTSQSSLLQATEILFGWIKQTSLLQGYHVADRPAGKTLKTGRDSVKLNSQTGAKITPRNRPQSTLLPPGVSAPHTVSYLTVLTALVTGGYYLCWRCQNSIDILPASLGCVSSYGGDQVGPVWWGDTRSHAQVLTAQTPARVVFWLLQQQLGLAFHQNA